MKNKLSLFIRFMIFTILGCGLLPFLGLTGCDQEFNPFEKTESPVRNKNTISFASWNTQTFFDADIEGTEYSDFQNLAKWSKDKYMVRLSRLCEVMTALNADIIVLEEIENGAVVQDIANQFAGDSWDRSKNWAYACFAKDQGSAIGCAVFSRFELKDLKIHSMNIQTQMEVQPLVRPIIQVTVDVDGKALTLFVNHWKSKSGGEEASEIWRDWQESILAGKLAELQKSAGGAEMACVLCGDFNRDSLEFVCRFDGKDKSPNTLLRSWGNGGETEIVRVYSPWFEKDGSFGSETGSYYFDEGWERIDHIFTLGKIAVSSFGPRTEGSWAGSDYIPKKYKIYNGEGYSDHLPVFAMLTLQ